MSMSKENHPNIQSIGLTVDVVNSIIQHIRGPAKKHAVGYEYIADLLQEDIVDFVTTVSAKLDEKYGINTLEDENKGS